MIYDCFTFFNELELLDLRLHELAGVVDRFVLVEATRTHSNQPKPLVFLENQDRFAKFKEKIIHVIVRDFPETKDVWALENFQRNGIGRGLKDCRPDDWILISDVDEIPRATTVRQVSEQYPPPAGFWADIVARPLIRTFSAWKFSRGRVRRNHPFVLKFRQSNHRQFINCVSVAPPLHANWYGTRMLHYRDFISAQEIRLAGYKIIENGGWHFSSMGGIERIQEKIRSYAHQEYNKPEHLDPEHMAKTLAAGKSLFHPEEVFEYTRLDDSYPRYLREHPEKFAGWIKPV